MSKNTINKSLYEAIFRKPEVFTELNPSNFPNVARDLSVEEERQLYAKDSHTNAGRLGHENTALEATEHSVDSRKQVCFWDFQNI